MWLSLPLGRAPLLHDQFQLLPLPLSQQAQECLNFRFGHPGHRQQLRNRWQRLNRGSGRVMMIARVMPNSGKVISLEAYRRRREDADPGQWMLDRFGRDAALWLRQQAGLTARVLAFRRT
jgi:hypothetical protein